jgi:DNA-binding FadR family transcriptional regulator
MKSKKERHSFRGAAELAEHAVRASSYLKEVYAACEGGDKAAARRALRQAIIELETARVGLRVGMD